MIQFFRNALNSLAVKLLLALLVVAFAIWGIGPGTFSQFSNSAATVGGTKISLRELSQAVERRAQDLQVQGVAMDTRTLVTRFGLDYSILQELIVRASVNEHARVLGLGASNAEIGRVLAEEESIRLPNGNVDVDFLRAQLQQQNVSERVFLDDIRQSIAYQQWIETLFSTNTLPRFMAEQLYSIEQERRTATLINIPASEIGDIEPLTDEALADYYEPRKAEYVTPERRTYNYLLVTPRRFYGDVELTEDDILREFEDRRGDYVRLEKRSVETVTVTDGAALKAIQDAVASGTSFKDAIVANTDFTAEEITAEELTESQATATYGEEAATAIFARETAGLTEATENAFGAKQLFNIVSIEAGENKTLEDVREDVRRDLVERRATDLMYDFLTRLEDAVADEGSVELAAELLEIPLASATNVDGRGLGAEGEALMLGAEERRINADAFRRVVGDDPEIEQINPQEPDDGVYVTEVVEVFAPEERPIADVADQLQAAYKAEERLKRAGEKAENGLTMLRAGTAPSAIIEALGGTTFEAKNVARTAPQGSDSSLSPAIRGLIFDLAPGQSNVEQSGDGYIIVRVESIKKGDPDASPIAVDARYEELKNAHRSDIEQLYQRYLLERFPATIDRARVDLLYRVTDPNAQ